MHVLFASVGWIVFCLSSLSQGAVVLKAPDFKLSRGQEEVRASAPEGHHFNLQAPKELRAGGRKVSASAASTEHELRFALKSGGEIEVRAYLCDDAKTFCEQHAVKLQSDGKQLSIADAEVGAPGHAGAPAAADAHGFIVNDAPAAFARAKKENKPLLVDFFGIWCPPCNQLEEHVFSSPEFAREKSRFVLLKLDADAEASWELKSKFKVGGYPTVVLATPEGEEISRVVGFRHVPEFVAEMKRAWEMRGASLAALTARAKQGDREAALRLARAHNERKEYEAAWTLLEKVAPDSEEGFTARIGKVEALSGSAHSLELAELYEKAIARFPDLPESVERGLSLAALQKDAPRLATLKSAAERAERLARSPELLSGRDYSPADLWSMGGDARQQLKDGELFRKDWSEAVREYRKLIRSEDERGYNLELAYALWQTGDSAGAQKIYQRLEKKFPKEFTFWFAHARLKVRERRLGEARQLAEKALAQSYGDNRLRSAQLLAEILMATHHEKEARKLVADEVARVRLPSDPSNRTHSYVKSLQAVVTSASKKIN